MVENMNIRPPTASISPTAFADSGVDRYPKPPALHDDDHYGGRTAKWSAALDLPHLDPSSEAALEDWADSVSAKCCIYRPPLPKLLEVMCANASAHTASLLSEIVPDTFEGIIDIIALKSFTAGRYPIILEDQLLRPPRHQTVLQAIQWMKTTTARLLRVSRRHNWEVSLSTSRLAHILLYAVPAAVHDTYLSIISDRTTNFHALCDSLFRCQTVVDHRHGSQNPEIVHQSLAMHAKDSSSSPEDQTMTNEQVSKKPNTPCRGCEGWHYRKNCPYKEYRCHTCHEIGHLSKCCQFYEQGFARKSLVKDFFKAFTSYYRNQAI
eukprot:GHVP01055965.1.p1 GENE.GHVP01055965.1~~GHVP01055965.1.p1  ORF type:complete len:322 (-),score=29.99 GHVP01055965.1:515-1480(-)